MQDDLVLLMAQLVTLQNSSKMAANPFRNPLEQRPGHRRHVAARSREPPRRTQPGAARSKRRNFLGSEQLRQVPAQLDPAHRAKGGRTHDSATVGDAFEPAYRPDVVVISENKDTAIHFPPFARAISVEGVGKGGRTIASFPWIRAAQTVVYWGDIDRDGFEILNGYRADLGRDIDTILMDRATYEAYERFGTNLDQHSKPIPPGIAKPVDRLRDDERALYLLILAPEHDGYRRIEQERIPLARAREAVEKIHRTSRPRF